ncbi:putative peptidoglycan muropeptide transporter SLC46 [Arctopsyche grandis]|uniref:putative peptidoglycan muropeptide transporter SLC46 n=1 Tax=Arctopsyche grandis TaxID=121162 RepID=UPI00406D8C61
MESESVDETRCSAVEDQKNSSETKQKCQEGWKELTFRQKCSKLKNYITVEPLLACYIMPSVLATLAVQNMNLEKACRVNQAYGDEVCTKLIDQQIQNLTEEVIQVQTLVANMAAWKYPLQTIIPAFMIVFIGAWSDRTGLRRPCMLMPIVGEFLTSFGLILCTFYLLEWPLETAGLIEALPPALTGGWTCMFMAVFSYISDNTSLEDRTFRTGIANVFVSVGMPVGTALSGIFTKVLGFYGIFSICMCLYIVGFLYGWFRITDKRRNVEENVNKNACTGFFDTKHVSDTLMVAFKTRDGSRRLRVMLLMLIFITITGPLYGETAVVYLFTRYRFKFTEVDYSIYVTYSVIINLIGTVLAMVVFSRYLKMDDSLIGAISGISKIAASFIYAFAPTVSWFYIAPIVDLLSGTGIIVMRSIASKLVEPNETGKIHSLFGVCEAIVPIIYSPMYSQMYVNTIETLPGAFFLLGALLMIPSIIVFLSMYVLEKRDRQRQESKDVDDKQKYAYENEITPL